MFQSVPLEFYLILSAVLFTIGTVGVLIRRNAIIIFMSIELMLNSVNLTLVSFSSFLGNVQGQIFVFFVMGVAAAEAAIGLAIVLALFRQKQTINIDEINILKW
jgi:NADH-quinone oxidoreductase subunit K